MTLQVVEERWVDARELAGLMSVSLSTVKRWTAEGMPSESWGLRVRRYRLSEALRWAAQRSSLAAGERRRKRRPGDQPRKG